MTMKAKEAYITPNRLDQKLKGSPCQIKIKTQNIQNQERILRVQRKKANTNRSWMPA